MSDTAARGKPGFPGKLAHAFGTCYHAHRLGNVGGVARFQRIRQKHRNRLLAFQGGCRIVVKNLVAHRGEFSSASVKCSSSPANATGSPSANRFSTLLASCLGFLATESTSLSSWKERRYIGPSGKVSSGERRSTWLWPPAWKTWRTLSSRWPT